MGALRVPRSGTTFGQQTWAQGWTHSWAEVPRAAALGIGAGASVYKETACDASLQNPCRIAYYGRILPNALFLKFFFSI